MNNKVVKNLVRKILEERSRPRDAWGCEIGREPSKLRIWLEDNFRIIISCLLVIAIAYGVYAYSEKVENDCKSGKLSKEECEQYKK